MSPNRRLGAMLPQTTLFMVEKISAVTLRVANMEASVRFYKDVLGLEIASNCQFHHQGKIPSTRLKRGRRGL